MGVSWLQIVANQNLTSPPPEFDLQCFWAVEQLGIVDDHDKSQHAIVQDKFDATVQFESDRYTVQWPWLEDNTMLPDNHSLTVVGFAP